MSRQDLALEQKVIRRLKALARPPQSVLVAVSGGLDSMALVQILHKWQRSLKWRLAVAHVHHGLSPDPLQARYRTETQTLVREWALINKLDFFTNENFPSQTLANEQDLREWRHHWLKTWRRQSDFEVVAFAHHQDDLLETRVMRLIRGSGAQGLRAMRFRSAHVMRPLLVTSRAELETYAQLTRLTWSEDPTNAETDAFRNWLRHTWLPALETRRPGAKESLSRSLELLVPKTSAVAESWPAQHVGVRRQCLSRLPRAQQGEVLASYLKALGLRGYARTHVDEILKRLAGPPPLGPHPAQFIMLGCIFHFTSDLVWASRV